MKIFRLFLNFAALFTFFSRVHGKIGDSKGFEPEPDVSRIDYASMEIRTAINYQTQAIETVLKNFTQVTPLFRTRSMSGV